MPFSVKEQFKEAPETWDINICETCYKTPKNFFWAFFCPPCAQFYQRKRILGGDLERYTCCGGEICAPCISWTDGLVKKAPECCLCTEILCCFYCSVGASRIMLQRKFHIRNTKFEDFLLILAFILSYVVMILSIFFPIPREVDCLIDCFYCCLFSCFQSQQEHELDVREDRQKSFKHKEANSGIEQV
ncbi:uncharacterized protein LOC135141179 [Zophobas morio]|uniref:uncharacterized protein LOC135141179 n=1 Tax=Zophobas morio TaxID=2755281 RepID=UPI003083D30F